MSDLSELIQTYLSYHSINNENNNLKTQINKFSDDTRKKTEQIHALQKALEEWKQKKGEKKLKKALEKTEREKKFLYGRLISHGYFHTHSPLDNIVLRERMWWGINK